MLSRVADVRMPAMAPQPERPEDPYQALVLAILHRAVQDALGHCGSPGAQSPEQIQAEARRWLADERAVAALVELCGLDAAPVLRRVRRLLASPTERQQLAGGLLVSHGPAAATPRHPPTSPEGAAQKGRARDYPG
jgi:hypothetical protein